MTRLRSGFTASQLRILCDVWEAGCRIYSGNRLGAIAELEAAKLVEVDRAFYHYRQRNGTWNIGERLTVWPANDGYDWRGWELVKSKWNRQNKRRRANARRVPSGAAPSGASDETVESRPSRQPAT